MANPTADFPRAGEADSTLALLREGYPFVTNRCRALGSDVFRARLMLTPVTVAQGAEAAEMFYAPGRFTRRRALPFTAVKMLQDYGSVQTLDGAAHAHRKRLFMALMGDEAIARMVALADEEWRGAVRGADGRLALLPATQRVLTRAVLRWAGLAPRPEDAEARARDYAAMLRGTGGVGAGAFLHGLALRTRDERWARRVIGDVRAGRLSPGPGEAARIIALHRDPEGRLLPAKIAAVELINVLRPVVAVGHFVVHAALALHRHPDWRDRLAGADEADLERFVQEVRRLAPFFPAVAGRVRAPFDWRGRRFEQGAWVMLDLWGTNHDPRVWDAPEAFRPDRFAAWDGSPWTLVPQGGGPYVEGHRCPGEWLTIALMKQAVRFLARDLDYTVPEQDLSVDLARIPAIPASGFMVEGLRLRDG